MKKIHHTGDTRAQGKKSLVHLLSDLMNAVVNSHNNKNPHKEEYVYLQRHSSRIWQEAGRGWRALVWRWRRGAAMGGGATGIAWQGRCDCIRSYSGFLPKDQVGRVARIQIKERRLRYTLRAHSVRNRHIRLMTARQSASARRSGSG